MRRLNALQMSLVSKLTALAIATMLLVLLLDGIFLVQNESTEHVLQGLANQGQARLLAIHDAHDNFLTWDSQANMWVGLGANGATSKLGLNTQLQANQARTGFYSNLAQLGRDQLDSQQLHLLSAIRTAAAGYDQIWTKIQRLDLTNHGEATNLAFVRNHTVSSEVRNNLLSLEASISQSNSSAQLSLVSTVNTQNDVALAMDIVVFGLMLLSIFAIRSSMAPLGIIRDILGRVTSGNYSLNESPLTHKIARRRDELGLLFQSSKVLANELESVSSERELHAKKLELIASFNATLAEAANTLISANSEQEMLDSFCETLRNNHYILSVSILRPNDQGSFEEIATSASISHPELTKASTDPSKKEGNNNIGRTWRKRRPIWSSFGAGGTAVASWRREANLAGYFSCVSLPIERDHKPWGILSLFLGELGLSRFDKDLLETISDLTGSLALGFARMDANVRELELAEIQKVLLETTFAGIGLVNDRHLVWANDRFVQIFGYENPADIIGTGRAPLVDELDQELIDRAYGKLDAIGSSYVANLRMRRLDGEEIICDLAFGKIHRQDSVHSVVWTIQDVTERRRLENQLQYQAEHDFLTGIPNRRAMEEQVRGAIERSKRAGSVCVLGVIDLDDFKLVNDRLGHSAGDSILTHFAERIKGHLRSPDFFARLGGDEFVLVLEDYDDLTVFRHLKRTFSRLHKLVEEPFRLENGIEVFQDMSMGVALYPKDAENPDDLLRVADAALYNIKLDKINRLDWWGFGARLDPEPDLYESQSDAYSEQSRAILATTKVFLSEVSQRFADEFIVLLGRDLHASSAMSAFPNDGSIHFAKQIASHLDFLFAADATFASRRERSFKVGETHGLVGVEGTLLTHAVTLFRRVLSEHINRGPLSPRQKHHLRAIAEVRLQDDLEAQLRAMDNLKERYSNVVTTPLPDAKLRWADLVKRETDSLSELPGVNLVMMLRLDNQKAFTIEKTAGILSAEAEAALSRIGIQMTNEAPADAPPSAAQWRGPSIRAWEQATIFSSGNFGNDPESKVWGEFAKPFGIRSILSIPILDSIGRPVAGVVLFGTQPNQFESHWMKQFATGVGNRFNELWRSRSLGVGEKVLSPATANYYRESLFSGGFTVFVQPIIDLSRGEVVSVEALARLQLPGGQIILPGDFLPLLGELEMEQLFRLALDRSLSHLAKWDRSGVRLKISVNLSPTTLLAPDCANTILSALQRWSIDRSRLTIELLESEKLDRQARDAAISRLTEIGIELAMDDLGEGYSGLRRMSEVPFSTIKIDRSLMASLIPRPIQTMVVIDTLNSMSGSLGKKVVLEGLETEAHLEMATRLGIPFGQGFGIAKPMPADDLLNWIEGFKFESDPMQVKTYLGGLAHHWKSGHDGPLESCPIAILLATKENVPVEIIRAHAELHSQATPDGSATELSEWLQRAIQQEL